METEYGLKVIITIPAYNEEKTIGKVVRNIKDVMNTTKYKHQYLVLVVDDGSEDQTKEEAKKLRDDDHYTFKRCYPCIINDCPFDKPRNASDGY
ncbi:MAG: glycosyltransferase [Asgard group archaeon]|nr:glycosyltransferase [Asgard group archaeon]